MFERLSGLEEELGATQAESHAHLQALAAASAEVEVGVCSHTLRGALLQSFVQMTLEGRHGIQMLPLVHF